MDGLAAIGLISLVKVVKKFTQGVILDVFTLRVSLFAAIVGGVFSFLVVDVYHGFQNADKEQDPFLSSFNRTSRIPCKFFPTKRFRRGPRKLVIKHPEYTVLVHRMIANLKAPDIHSNPMATMELYIEASNQECAIEIHNREAEVRDIVERSARRNDVRRFGYRPRQDATQSENSARGINRILNRGTAKKIMFKALNIKYAYRG